MSVHLDRRPIDGESLVRELRQGSSPLPNRTLFALAVGGLRVRLLRSMVTTVSIVLAIAFLSYMGLTNQLTHTLAETVHQMEQSTDPEGLTGRRGFVNQTKEIDAGELRSLLRRAGVDVASTVRGDPLDTWLIMMALLTCGVGIMNAMLMSVTERIREIGTMKCLGAQDGLVIKLFLIESSLLGLVGAAAGTGTGVVVALIAAVLQFKSFGLVYFPLGDGAPVIGLSLLAGVVLAVCAAVYPAVFAARMKPVDALRIDE